MPSNRKHLWEIFADFMCTDWVADTFLVIVAISIILVIGKIVIRLM